MTDYLKESDWMRFENWASQDWDGPFGRVLTSGKTDARSAVQKMLRGIYHRQTFHELLLIQRGRAVKSFGSKDLLNAGKYARNLYYETLIPVECRWVKYSEATKIEDEWIYFFEGQSQSVGEFIICFLEQGINTTFIAGLWDMSPVNVDHMSRSGRKIADNQERTSNGAS